MVRRYDTVMFFSGIDSWIRWAEVLVGWRDVLGAHESSPDFGVGCRHSSWIPDRMVAMMTAVSIYVGWESSCIVAAVSDDVH